MIRFKEALQGQLPLLLSSQVIPEGPCRTQAEIYRCHLIPIHSVNEETKTQEVKENDLAVVAQLLWSPPFKR